MKIIKKAMCAVILLTLFYSFTSNNANAWMENAASSVYKAKDVIKEAINTIDEITVKEYDNKIALFREGEDEPFRIIDIPVFTLPRIDRDALSNGFVVASDKIAEVIEDFTG